MQEVKLTSLLDLRKNEANGALRNNAGDLAKWQAYRRSVNPESAAFIYCKFIELFCNQENYCIPTIDKTGLGKEWFKDISLKDLDPATLLKIANPEKIKKSLLQKTKIPFRQNDDKKLIVDLQLIKDLADFFHNLKPLKFETNNDKQSASKRFWIVGSESPLAGQIIRFTSTYEADGKYNKKEPALAVFTDIASCMRSRVFERQTAASEIEATSLLKTGVGYLADRFWVMSTESAEAKAMIVMASDDVAKTAEGQLKNAIVPVKVKADQQISAGHQKTDSRGRVNPPAKAMLLGAATNNLGQRLHQVEHTSQYNETDFILLRSVYLKAKYFFEFAKSSLDRAAKVVRTPDRHAFFNPQNKAKMRVSQLDGFLANCGITTQVLGALAFRGFKPFSEAIQNWRDQTAKIIGSADFPAKQKKIAEEQIKELGLIIKCAADVYPKYLQARQDMNGENGLKNGRLKTLEYIADLQELFNQGFMSDSETIVFQVRLRRIKRELNEFRPPAGRNPLNYLKLLSGKVDISDYLAKNKFSN